MKITVLGSSGSETPGHNLSAFLIDEKVMMDAGSAGSSMDLAKQSRIEYILLSHAHFDHIRELPFLLDNISMGARKSGLKLISGTEVLKDLKKHIFNGRIWPDFTKGVNGKPPLMELIEIAPSSSLAFDGYTITSERVNHSVPSYGFIVEKAGGKAIAYTGDTGPTETFWKKLSNHRVTCLITEVSYPNRMENLALITGHLTPDLLKVELGKIAILPGKICISHMKTPFLKEIGEEIEQLGIGNIEILRDGQSLIL